MKFSLVLAAALAAGCSLYTGEDHTDARPADAGSSDAAVSLPDASWADADYRSCGDSIIEPNDSLAGATLTPIPDFSIAYEIIGLWICPAGDRDLFQFRVDDTGYTIRASIDYDSAQGSLAMELLNGSGAVVRSGTPVGGDPDLLMAEVSNAPPDTYYLQIRGAATGVQNTYGMYIEVNP